METFFQEGLIFSLILSMCLASQETAWNHGGNPHGLLLAKKPGSQQLLIQKHEFSMCVNTTPKPERVFAQNLPRLQTKAAINWVKQQPVTRRLWVEGRVNLKTGVNLKTRAKSSKICNCAKQKREAARSGLALRAASWHLWLHWGPEHRAVLPSGWQPGVQQASIAPGVPACHLVSPQAGWISGFYGAAPVRVRL